MKIGLALGSGSARGWAHIGVIEVLKENGIRPEIVAGTSIGAIVGASYAAGRLEQLKKQVLDLNKLAWATYFTPSTSLDGWINHGRLKNFLEDAGISPKAGFDSLKKSFGCVACDLESGKEKWFREGNVFEAVWASMAMPGVFPAVRLSNRWYIDGGIINPVPVSLCRAMGADIVIAVNLNADILTRTQAWEAPEGAILKKVKKTARKILPEHLVPFTDGPVPPKALENVSRSINIAQDIITRSRLAGDPPDVLITPRLAQIGLFETYRGPEAIEEGRLATERMLEAILEVARKPKS